MTEFFKRCACCYRLLTVFMRRNVSQVIINSFRNSRWAISLREGSVKYIHFVEDIKAGLLENV